MLRNVLAGLLALCFAVSAHAADQVPLKRNNGIPAAFGTGDTVGVAHGGTGDVSLTAHCVLVGAGTSAAHLVCPTMSGYVLTDNGAGSDPSFQAASGGGGSPGGSSGQMQYNNAGAFGGFTLANDCTFSVPNITCTKLNSVSPGSFFSGTDAANLTGTVACARLAAVTGDVTSSAGSCARTIANGAVTEAKITLANNTTNNVSTSAHGFAPILPNDATKYLDGTGAYSTPTSSLPSIASGDVLGNSTAGSATASDTTLTALLDRNFGSTQGNLVVRGASTWGALAAGVSGYPLVSNGPGATPSYQTLGGSGISLTGVFALTSPTRALNTVYQNTTGFPIIVMADCNSSGTPAAYVDSSSANVTSGLATSLASSMQTLSGSANAAIFVVPNNYYYKVADSSFFAWTEMVFNTGSATDSGSLNASRALNTVYHNTNTGFMVIEVVVNSVSTGATIQGITDANAAPTSTVFNSATSSSSMSVFLIVAPGDYYKVTASAGSIQNWREVTFSIPAVRRVSTANRTLNRSGGVPAVFNLTGKSVLSSVVMTMNGTGTLDVYQNDAMILGAGTNVWQTSMAGGRTNSAIIAAPPSQFTIAYQDSSSTPTTTSWTDWILN